MSADVAALARAAHATPVVVIGSSLAGLVAAAECARLGMPVTVIERDSEVGGSIRAADLGGRVVDAGISGYEPGTAIDALLSELGLSDDIVTERTTERWTALKRPLRMPAGVLGIPTNPFLTEAVHIVGWGGAWRAYLDRLRPPLTIGQAERLGVLVSKRMGKKVTQRLVAPSTRARLALPPADVHINTAVPELNAALTRQGSLSGAAGELVEAEADRGMRSLRSGFASVTTRLADHLRDLEGVVLVRTSATGVVRSEDGYLVSTHGVDPATGEETHTQIEARIVVVATAAADATELLAGLVRLPEGAASGPVATVTVEVPAGLPDRGAGVFPQPHERVIAIDDNTARWSLGGDTRILAVSLTDGDESDQELIALAHADAQRLIGSRFEIGEALVHRYTRSSSRAAVGFTARRAAVLDAVAEIPGLVVAGSWVSGAEVDGIVADVRASVERVRRRALFVDSSGTQA